MIRFLLSIMILVTAGSVCAEEAKFDLSSLDFKQDGDIPAKFTCQSGDVNPNLAIANLPEKAKSIALTVHSPDAPEGTWVHWVVYNIPPTKITIGENTIPGYQALNDFGKYNYAGPCPTDDKPHQFIFRAYALDTVLYINEGMTMKDLEKVMGSHIVAKAELKGLYRKPVW